MLNQIVLIGRIKEMLEKDNKKEILLEVERPFKENNKKESDVFKCKAWSCIFNKVLNLCNIGDILAIKGRVIKDNNEFIVHSESIMILNKYRDNILKNNNI